MRELYYGGWVSENIYYLGASGVIDILVKSKVNGKDGQKEDSFELYTLGGVSGIEASYDYLKGLHEVPPFDQNSIRSIYHYRQYETEKLKLYKNIHEKFTDKQKANICDIFMSHEWPQMVTDPSQVHHNQIKFLLKKKKHF